MSDPRGATLIELLVLLTILAILSGIAMALTRPSMARHVAIALASELTAARLEALAGGAPTAVVLAPDGRSIERRRGSVGGGAAGACGGDARDGGIDLRAYPQVSVTDGLDRGVVWFPAGWGRSCDGGGVYNSRILVADRGARYAVVVSSAGRVRWEPDR